MSCIFCGEEPAPTDGPHHILPRVVRRAMNWQGKRAKLSLTNYVLPMCGECHRKVTLLQEPLVKIIKYLRSKPPVPIEFMYLMDGVYTDLIQSSEFTNKCEDDKDG